MSDDERDLRALSQTSVPERARRSVLVVEDNPSVLKLFRLALETEGYDVRGAGDARKAIEHATSELPDLVLQDLVLPDMEGVGLLRILRALPGGESLPVIAISGFKRLLDRASTAPHGFDATLLKPVTPAQLVELVRGYLPLPVRAEQSFADGKSVLVIDDDPIQLELVRLRLTHLGFDVRTAGDGPSALEEAQQRPPDVVLCDVLMPKTDDYELCRALRSLPALQHVPVVLASAFHGGEKDEKLARSAGANALVLRTPELTDVIGALRDAVSSSPRSSRAVAHPPDPDEHLARVMAQLEQQTRTSAGFAERAAQQAAQLSILTGIAEALLRSDDIEGAFSDVLAACLDAGGISRGALYGLDPQGELVLTQALGFPEASSAALERAFGCSARVVWASPGVVVPVTACLSEAEARGFLEIAGVAAAVFVPFLEGGRCVGALLLGSSSADMGEHELMVFARAIGAHVSQALALSESFTRLRDAAEAGRVLSGSLDLEQTLAALARLATARLADVCEIELLTGGPRVYTSGRTCDPSLGQRIRELRAAYPRFVATPGAEHAFPSGSELVPEINEARLRHLARDAEHLRLLSALELKSEIVVPLLARGRVLGNVVFSRVGAGRAFSERDHVAAQDLASRAAIAIDNASLYEMVQSASRLKDEFLATVSHELRTPLMSILGWARLLGSGRLDPAKRENAYRVIERNANAQAQLIEDLLDTSRITSGQMRLDLTSLDLTRVIDLAVESLKPALELKSIQLRRVAPNEPINLRGDAARLQQVIWNLLSNAVKFTPSGGRVSLAVARRGAHVTLTITDNGQGIAPEFLDVVFDRFKQVEGGITRAQGGLGLGLAITRQLVELHGGTIRAHSPGKGRGASFSIELPCSEALLDVAPIKKADTGRLRFDASHVLENVAVLVVDDDADTRELLVEALHGCGARARGAGSAAEAFDAVSHDCPDILLSDIGMPGEDGYALIRKIRTLPPARGGAIPAAALTAYTRSEDRSLALEAGFQLHLAKPLDPSALIAAVVRLSQMAAASKQM